MQQWSASEPLVSDTWTDDLAWTHHMKKALREMQTLCAGCSKAEPKIFTPPQTRFSGAQDGQNLISWRRSLPSPTNSVWWGSMHAISSYRSNRPTNTATNPHTNRQDRLQYTVPQLVHSVNLTTQHTTSTNTGFAPIISAGLPWVSTTLYGVQKYLFF